MYRSTDARPTRRWWLLCVAGLWVVACAELDMPTPVEPVHAEPASGQVAPTFEYHPPPMEEEADAGVDAGLDAGPMGDAGSIAGHAAPDGP
jgi:hypothetical protein